MPFHDPPKRRNVNRATAAVRAALKQAHERISVWHEAAAFLQAKITVRPSDADRQEVLQRVRKMREEIAAERSDLIRIFMDQPPALAGHSRVVDTEKSLDHLEDLLDRAERRLEDLGVDR